MAHDTELPDLSTRHRRVWVWADSHNGQTVDGKDGGRWAELATQEMLERVGPADYVLILGDVSHAYKEAHFRRYARLRRRSGIPRWYEIVGNHDFHGTETGLYQRIVRREFRYVVLDGNLCWVFVSAERGRAAGILRAPTRRWLKEVVRKYQDKNLIVCSHQLVANTVRRTHPRKDFECILNPRQWVSNLRRHYRIDAWLGGHEHGPPRDERMALRKGRTTFINVASFSHSYGTEACNSFWLEMKAGGREIAARCRDHDAGRFVDAFGTRISLPFPLRLGRQPALVDVGPGSRR
jgi:hypothetical protein